MGTSLGKYKTGLHQLMFMWKQETGLPDKVRLRVFGYVRERGDRQLYLKPFMIAQATAPAA